MFGAFEPDGRYCPVEEKPMSLAELLESTRRVRALISV